MIDQLIKVINKYTLNSLFNLLINMSEYKIFRYLVCGK